jgi:hypothetical protein
MSTAAALVVTAPPAVDGPYEALTRRTNAELDVLFAASPAPDPRVLVGYEWRGFNTPRWTRWAGIQKFIKGFFEIDGNVEGYNLRVPQNGITGPWTPMPRPEAPAAFGFFTVTQPKQSETLLDYGASRRNRWWRIDDVSMKVLRDYLVVPDEKHPDIMLGKAWMQIGPFRIFSNYFVVQKLRPAVWEPQPDEKQLPASR